MKKWRGNDKSSDPNQDNNKKEKKESRIRSEYNRVKDKTKTYSTAISSKTKNLYDKSTSAVQRIIRSKDRRIKKNEGSQSPLTTLDESPLYVSDTMTTLPSQNKQNTSISQQFILPNFFLLRNQKTSPSSNIDTKQNSVSNVDSELPKEERVKDRKFRNMVYQYYARSKEVASRFTSKRNNTSENSESQNILDVAESNSTSILSKSNMSTVLDTQNQLDQQQSTSIGSDGSKKSRFSTIRNKIFRKKEKSISSPVVEETSPQNDSETIETKEINSSGMKKSILLSSFYSVNQTFNSDPNISQKNKISKDSYNNFLASIDQNSSILIPKYTEEEYNSGSLPPSLAQVYVTMPFYYFERNERLKNLYHIFQETKDKEDKALNDSLVVQRTSLNTQSDAQYINILNPHFLVYRDKAPLPSSVSYFGLLISYPIFPIQHILCMLKFCFSSNIISSSCPTTDIILKSHRIESEIEKSNHQISQINPEASLTPSDYICSTPMGLTTTPNNQNGKLDPSVSETVKKYVSMMAGTQNHYVLRIFCWLLTVIFKWLLNGIYVDYVGTQVLYDELKMLVGKNIGIVFLPSHKSHFDYLLLSYVSYAFNLPIPSIASGDNLNIPLVGSLFRHSGAFFMRRTFGDDQLYRAVFESYVEELLIGGSPLEFFIEGGRSRDGTILAPKLGLLKVIIDSYNNHKFDDILLVPISVDYEEIPEIRTYVNHLLGGKKTPESLMNLLKAGISFLGKDFGNVFITYGKPMSLSTLIQNLHQLQPDMSDREELRFIGGNICHAMRENIIATNTTIMSATLLWNQKVTNIPYDVICSRVSKLHSWIKNQKGLAVEIKDIDQFIHIYLNRYGHLLNIQYPDTSKDDFENERKSLKPLNISIKDDIHSELQLDYMRKGIYHLFAADSAVLYVLYCLRESSIQYTLSDLLEILYKVLSLVYYQIPYICTDLMTILRSLTNRGIIKFRGQDRFIQLSSFTDNNIQDYIDFCVSLSRDYMICTSVFFYMLEGFRGFEDQIELSLSEIQKLICTKLGEYYQYNQIEYGLSMNIQTIKNIVDFACENNILAKKKGSKGSITFQFDIHYKNRSYYYQYLGLSSILFKNINYSSYESRWSLHDRLNRKHSAELEFESIKSQTPSIEGILLLRHYDSTIDYHSYMLTSLLGPFYHNHDKIKRNIRI